MFVFDKLFLFSPTKSVKFWARLLLRSSTSTSSPWTSSLCCLKMDEWSCFHWLRVLLTRQWLTLVERSTWTLLLHLLWMPKVKRNLTIFCNPSLRVCAICLLIVDIFYFHLFSLNRQETDCLDQGWQGHTWWSYRWLWWWTLRRHVHQKKIQPVRQSPSPTRLNYPV